MRHQTLFVIGLFVSAASSACVNPPATYASPRAGYALRMPRGFIAAHSHEEVTVATEVGPLDLGAADFVYQGDGLFTGGQRYVALGMRFEDPAVVMTPDDASIASIDAGMTKSLLDIGKVRERRRADDAGGAFVGEEVIVDGSGPTYGGRTLHIRLFVTPHAAYFLLAGADTKHADEPYFRQQREAFFGAFQLTEGAGPTPKAVEGKRVDGPVAATVAARASRILFQ